MKNFGKILSMGAIALLGVASLTSCASATMSDNSERKIDLQTRISSTLWTTVPTDDVTMDEKGKNDKKLKSNPDSSINDEAKEPKNRTMNTRDGMVKQVRPIVMTDTSTDDTVALDAKDVTNDEMLIAPGPMNNGGFLQFNEDATRVNGNDGCNVGGSDVTFNGDTINFGGFFSTMMYCEGNTTDWLYQTTKAVVDIDTMTMTAFDKDGKKLGILTSDLEKVDLNSEAIYDGDSTHSSDSPDSGTDGSMVDKETHSDSTKDNKEGECDDHDYSTGEPCILTLDDGSQIQIMK